jgi:curved DNA-binding protein CbpA
MTDYFALLNQPRSPWLDPKKLKEIYHEKTLRWHPDVQAGGEEAPAFSSLNEAYQTLQDPKRRLHHLLGLQGCAPSSAAVAVPAQLHDLFPKVGAVTQRTSQLLDKLALASNALSRSLLERDVLLSRTEIDELLSELRQLHDGVITQLPGLGAAWSINPDPQIDRLTALYHELAYLTRWIAQMEELQLRLSLP